MKFLKKLMINWNAKIYLILQYKYYKTMNNVNNIFKMKTIKKYCYILN